MKKLSSKVLLAKAKKDAEKRSFVSNSWETVGELSTEKYGEADPNFLQLDFSRPSKVIRKKTKEGKPFLKLSMPMKSGANLEFPLSYDNEFIKDDLIDTTTIVVCLEVNQDKKEHWYVTGDFYDGDDVVVEEEEDE